MKSARPIALWLAAVIVMITAALMPSGARAHGAHGHAAQAEHVVSAPETSAPLADAASFAAVGAHVRSAGLSLMTRADAVPVMDTSRIACACPACLAGGACGHAPSSCCATGLAPAPLPGLAPPAPRDRALTYDGPRLSGIVPDAQIEPPRRLA
ncbi:hypothetical protein [Methylobacterium sp. R2-1]|uniref:hypothetical protein n=1 Tax=Methylobacterium sp. R2-1 TaxID=2587064 RepID=UPI00160FE68A|nr:hypothetical protein [Methylobacterium sp. R2-1]MBB2960112.1 hypothetical protein [Methylobacterium sp. R2-1]